MGRQVIRKGTLFRGLGDLVWRVIGRQKNGLFSAKIIFGTNKFFVGRGKIIGRVERDFAPAFISRRRLMTKRRR